MAMGKVAPAQGQESGGEKASESITGPEPDRCPYCRSAQVVRRGFRQRKYLRLQLYLCNDCGKTFSAQKVKRKAFPLRLIFEGLSLYNLGHSQQDVCDRLKERFGLSVDQTTLSCWIKEFEPLLRYARLRPHGTKLYGPSQVIATATLYHRQVYSYRYHRAKTALALQEFKHERFEPLREYLEAVPLECPHELFKHSARASEQLDGFDISGVRFIEKQNFATRLAGLALQAVANNKERHEFLQRFMLANDSCTVSTEVPVYLTEEDLDHLRNELGYLIPEIHPENGARRVLTGHIDLLQLRNGHVHILDYKPNARKARPIGQLTFYALALSRLTGLRIFDFVCAYFDEERYVQWFPLHIVKKLRRGGLESPDQLKLFEEA